MDTSSARTALKLQKTIGEKGATPATIRAFQTVVNNYYKKHRREFEWRNSTNPYHIVVSEIMLQQTQTARVEQKYSEWLSAFPDWESLARASLKQILKTWQGMGYNRRALALRACAQKVVSEYHGSLPHDPGILATFPHIGPNTAGSICAFAFNMPTVFIETNIRTVFIFFFFSRAQHIRDTDILELVERTLDKKLPREWYCALMDFGAMLKKTISNPNRKSAHYAKQSKFAGSDRQIRGAVLKLLSARPRLTGIQIAHILKAELSLKDKDHKRVKKNISALAREGFIAKKRDRFMIS